MSTEAEEAKEQGKQVKTLMEGKAAESMEGMENSQMEHEASTMATTKGKEQDTEERKSYRPINTAFRLSIF